MELKVTKRSKNVIVCLYANVKNPKNRKDAVHILRRCPVAIQALIRCGIDLPSVDFYWRSSDVVFSFIFHLKAELRETVAMCLWQNLA